MSAQQPAARDREHRTAARALARGTRLSPEDVRTIRDMIRVGYTDAAIAADYEISTRMVAYIRTGKRWASVT